MRGNDQKSMSIDELSKLYADVTFEFSQRLLSEEIELEQRLHELYRLRRSTGLRRYDA